jgi:hypothetical protein
MFVVKKLGKNGLWSAVSLIDQNGSFRGEAKFETRKDAEEYMAEYLNRMKTRMKASPEGYGDVKVFDGDETIETSRPIEQKSRKVKSKSKRKAHEKQKKKVVTTNHNSS